MRCHRLAGVHRRRWRHPHRELATWPDRVQRRFTADCPDRLWVTDITQHRTAEGWVFAAVVLDVFSRRVVGWSIADHLRTELVIDARWQHIDLVVVPLDDQRSDRKCSEEWVLEGGVALSDQERTDLRAVNTRPDRASALLREELPA